MKRTTLLLAAAAGVMIACRVADGAKMQEFKASDGKGFQDASQIPGFSDTGGVDGSTKCSSHAGCKSGNYCGAMGCARCPSDFSQGQLSGGGCQLSIDGKCPCSKRDIRVKAKKEL
jgi:hypothetical protein